MAESVDPEASSRMLIASAQMTATQLLAGVDPAVVDRMSQLFIAAALGRVVPLDADAETPA